MGDKWETNGKHSRAYNTLWLSHLLSALRFNLDACSSYVYNATMVPRAKVSANAGMQ